MSSLLVKSLSVKFEILRKAIESGDIVLITGHPSTGKTTVAKAVLKEHPEYLSIYINCNNIVSTSELYLEIQRLLFRKLKQVAECNIVRKNVATASEFNVWCKMFKELAAKKNIDRIFVILDQVELFKKTPMMEAIVLLSSFSEIDFILISGEIGIDLFDGIQFPSCRCNLLDKFITVELVPWSKEDLIESILKQQPSESKVLYRKFVHNIVSTVYTTTSKDFVELRSFCQENFQEFLEFYKLKFNEILKKFGEDELVMDNIDFDDYDDYLPSNIITSSINDFLSSFKESIRARRGEVREWGNLTIDRKVVLHTAALIIASYVAAYSRRSDDKKNFINYQKREKISKRFKLEQPDIDPKVFTMERLIHIYRGIVIILTGLKKESSILRHDSVLSDIQLLQDLDLISKYQGDGLDSQTRFRISHHVTADYVKSLSRSIDFELESLTGLPANTR